MSNIECSICRTIVAVTADTIALPFVCLACENVNDEINIALEENFTEQEYTDMAPAHSVAATASTVNVTGSTEPTEEFATVENTTLLIEDLETQVRDLRERNDWQAKTLTEGSDYSLMLQRKVEYFEKTLAPHIDSLEAQVRNQAGTIARLEQQNDVLLGRNIFLRTGIVELVKMVKGLRVDVALEKNRANIEKTISASLERTVQSLADEKNFAVGRARYWQAASDGLELTNRLEKSKSLWQCFKDRYFDKVTENAGYAG
jgi:ribosome-binding protein aMBF1 (putative translation factor)